MTSDAIGLDMLPTTDEILDRDFLADIDAERFDQHRVSDTAGHPLSQQLAVRATKHVPLPSTTLVKKLKEHTSCSDLVAQTIEGEVLRQESHRGLEGDGHG